MPFDHSFTDTYQRYLYPHKVKSVKWLISPLEYVLLWEINTIV